MRLPVLENYATATTDRFNIYCSMTELDAEVGVLRTGLKDIEKELSYFEKKAIASDRRKDKFVSVMSDFVTVAAYNFSELEENVVDMKQKASTGPCHYV